VALVFANLRKQPFDLAIITFDRLKKQPAKIQQNARYLIALLRT